jgi:chemotaxis protein methyltransferase CheR
MASGDQQAAIVAFRKWIYLEPDDGIAHLHLSLALEAAGDHASARRAYSAARQAVIATDTTVIEGALEGYTKDELLRLVNLRQQVAIP